MPPYLHPRSGMTTSLFTTTLAVSFLVVGIPHILPCPVNSKQFADSESGDFDTKRPRRLVKKRLRQLEDESDPDLQIGSDRNDRRQDDSSLSDMERARRRECPVPKPGGLIGEVLGFRKGAEDELPPPRMVKIESIQSRRPAPQRDKDQ